MLRLPTGAGIRIDTGIEQGDRIPAEFDSMIAKIIAHGRDRDEALSRLRRALLELAVAIQGGTTNRAFLLELLNLPTVLEGKADVGWLDREPPSQWSNQYSGGEIALALAAVHEYEEEFDAERQLFLSSAARGRPKHRAEIGCTVELRHGGNLYRLNVYRFSGERFRVDMGGQSLQIKIETLSRFERRLSCANQIYRTVTVHSGFDYLIEIDGNPHRVSRDDGGMVRSPMPAIVVAVKVEAGDEIRQGDTLVILEAMKLEMRVTSPFSGTVRTVDVAENEQVDAGAPLLRLMPSAGAGVDRQTDRLSFESLCCVQQLADEVSADQRFRDLLDELQNLLLGYDVHPQASTSLVAELRESYRNCPTCDESIRQRENLLLARFSDLSALSGRQPAAHADRSGLPSVTDRSHQESLFTYLRALHAKGEGLSRTFVDDMKRALAHYGIEDLEPSHPLEEALLWLVKSHSRVEYQIPAVIAILERHLNEIDPPVRTSDDDFRDLLDRLISVSQGRYAAVADLAQEVRYKYFDKPLLEASRDAAYQQAADDLAVLTQQPSPSDREKHMTALVECPQPLITVLSRHFVAGDEAMRESVIECLARRYYRIRELEDIRILKSRGHPFVAAEYEHDCKRISLITTHTTYEDITHTGNLILPLLDGVPADHDVVIDLFIHREGMENSEEDTLTHVREAIDAIPFSRGIRRIVTSVRIPGAGLGMTGQRFFSFRPSDHGYREEKTYRGLHPMMAKRLHLRRFDNFRLERLPSIEDVYLFHAMARDNPKDERLFAVAEVRDLSAFRDEAGKLTGLPHLEHMLQEALAGIRSFQSHRPVRQRLHWNRIVLYGFQGS
jgi:biotin carboxyl carrier protein